MAKICSANSEKLITVKYHVRQSDLLRLTKVLDYLNNYPTRLIRVPGSSRWGLAPTIAIKLERVESRPSTKYKRPVGNNETMLNKGDTVRYYLLTPNGKVVWKIRNVQLIQYGFRLYLRSEKSLSLKTNQFYII